MRSNVQDQEIVKLLTKLKDAEHGYPQELLAARRQRYLEQVGTVAVGLGAGQVISEAVKNVRTPPASPSATNALLEAALVVAIVAEAGTVAFLYREKVADFLRTLNPSPNVQEVTPPPVGQPSQASISISFTPGLTSTVVTPTISPSPTGTASLITETLSPGDVVDETDPIIEIPTQAVATQVPPTQAVSTPVPNEENGDNGNHYGQTPKPERTIEPGSGNQPSNENQGAHP